MKSNGFKWLGSRDWRGRKERRREWEGSKNFDPTCRNHGGCDWCLGNRMHSTKKREPLEDEY